MSHLNPRLRARFERLSESEKRMTKEQKAELCALLPDGRVRLDEPMNAHSSMGVGGPVEAFVTVENVEEIKKVIVWSVERNIDYRFFGGGSNVLVRDGGLRGLAIRLGDGFDSIDVDRQSGDEVFVKVGAATSTQKAVRWAAEQGFSGMEVLVGVWGTVGGNIVTNAGTANGAIGDIVEEITIVTKDGRELTTKRSALHFEYRSLKLPRTAAMISVLIKLGKSSPENVRATVDAAIEKRNSTQPSVARSLGCIFRNTGKTPAGMLIEDAGLKGVRVGGARVSGVHANFIVNEGKATAKDVTVLINLVRERVRENSSITLETEIEIVGDE